ncbi:MAG: hypothetical protein LQ351_006776 [Letrouitia transgressa]|nr:MAG: hypothetical protein LQ351_006776 [Letrouitia transgressa]
MPFSNMCCCEKLSSNISVGASTESIRRSAPVTPPSSAAASRSGSFGHYCPQQKDLAYVTEQLWTPTQRFSYENPIYMGDEEHKISAPLLLTSSYQDEDSATISNDASRTESRCSEATVSGDAVIADQWPLSNSTDSFWQSKDLELSRYPSFGRSLPPPATLAPSTPDVAKGCLRTTSGNNIQSPPVQKRLPSARQISTPIDHIYSLDPCSDDYMTRSKSSRTTSRHAYEPHRSVPETPLVEEISAWDDSDDEEERETQSQRFRRRLSKPFRHFIFRRMGSRRKTA